MQHRRYTAIDPLTKKLRIEKSFQGDKGDGWGRMEAGKLSSGINANTIDFHSGGETHVLFFLTQQDLDRKAHDFCCCFKTKIMSLFLCLLMAGGDLYKTHTFKYSVFYINIALIWWVALKVWTVFLDSSCRYVGIVEQIGKPGRWEGSPITVNIRPKTKFELLLRRNFARAHII